MFFLNLPLLTLFPLYTLPACAEIILSAPPRENPEAGMMTYGPLAEYLSKVLKEKVVYQHPGGWARYTTEMRNDRYDIVFDAPHFGAWRIKNLSHMPVVRLPGKLGFVVITHKRYATIKQTQDLLALKICAMASPNLGTVSVYNLFPNPINLPRLHETKGGFPGIYKAFKEGKCDAAVLRDSFYQKLPPDEKAQVKIVSQSPPIPNQTITISPRLAQKHKFIAGKLISSAGQKASAPLLRRFGKRNDKLLPTEKSEFSNLENLLTGVIWGW